MDVLKFEEGANEVSRSLGIDDKRADELQELCCESVAKYDSITECMDIMQTIAKNHGELAYCNFRIGLCARCPASAIKKMMGEDEDIDSKLNDLWRRQKGKDDKA